MNHENKITKLLRCTKNKRPMKNVTYPPSHSSSMEFLLPNTKCEITRNNDFPPLIQNAPWTKKIFYRDNENVIQNKEDKISNGKVLQYSYIPPKKKPKKKNYGPIGEDGELRFPRKKTQDELLKEKLARKKEEEKKRKDAMQGFVSLNDLLNGEYFKRKAEERANKCKIIEKKRRKENDWFLEQQAKETQKLINLQAGLPKTPEEQLTFLQKEVQEKCHLKLCEDEISRIQYYMKSNSVNSYLSPYPIALYSKSENLLYRSLKNMCNFSKLTNVMKLLQQNIHEDYIYASKESTLHYVLKDPYERLRLKISRLPFKWPYLTIRSPMPWHTNVTLSKQRLFYFFFHGNKIISELHTLWNEKYDFLLICNMNEMQKDSPFPLYCDVFEQRLIKQCEESRFIIINEWLCDVADIMVRLRHYWKDFAPKKRKDKTFRVEIFFRTVCAVMSAQLRSLVIRSLEHFSNEFSKYKDGNDFGEQYKDNVLNKQPLLLTKIISHPDTGELCFSPTLKEIKELLHSCLVKIINVNKNVSRVETLLFPEFSNKNLLLFCVNEHEEYMQKIIGKTLDYFNINCTGPLNYLNVYNPFNFITTGNAKEELLKMYKTQPFPRLVDFANQIEYYETLRKRIIFLRRHVPLNMIMLDCTIINDFMCEIINALRQNIVDYFIDLNNRHNKEICEVYQNMSQRASEMPETTGQLVDLLNYIDKCRDVTLYELKEKSKITAENVLFLMDYAYLSTEDISLNSRVFVWPSDMQTVIDLSLKTLTSKRNMAEETLKNRRSVFEEKLKRHERLLDAFKKLDPPLINMEVMKDYVTRIDEIYNKLMEDKQEANHINEEEGLLDHPISDFSNLVSMLSSVDPFHKLWHISLDFHVGYEKWYYGPFIGLNAESIKNTVQEQWKLLHYLSKHLADYQGAKSVAYLVRARVDKFKILIPVLEAICNEGLQNQHWEKISELIGKPIELKPDSSLSDMIELGLQLHIENLQDISLGASKEYALKISLDKMKEEWIGVNFECVLYRETGVSVLSSVDDIQLMLDDHILKSQTMRGSPYVKPFESDMQAWEEKLISMQDILDQWLQVQSVWMYLEPIFSSEDIMRQMPMEARNFKEVDREWRNIMNATVKNSEVLTATDYPGLLASLKSSNNFLSDIQRSLNDYLDKKRLFFPRFFFLSNDELLEILSETKDPMRVQPHLKKCFEGIYSLQFNDQGEIVALVSSEDENVTLASSINPEDAKGMVERWLCQLEEQMIASLRDISLECTTAYFSDKKADWILKWPGQVVQVVNFIHFTAQVTDAIEKQSLVTYHETCNSHIEEIVRLIQTNLDIAKRITLEALIIIDVHGRDIVHYLSTSSVRKPTDFQWISQMRYYWRENSITCSMVATDVAYAFEYLGNTGRLVATPLTDRCFRTLMSAYKLNLGGAPEGPAGTGKTETCKDLAKAIAKKCVVFNCSDTLDYKALGKFFKGLAQSGAWACFDEFNRIELEVLSVVAQQILNIQSAVMRKAKRFNFEGADISLNPTCAIFITMNPGYAGRHELPDNLKVLFRTVAMMVPDYCMIGEIILYSNGFINAKILAGKIVQTYKLCSELLSSQNHYDYGMRAVKSVLSAASSLKTQYSEEKEDVLVLRAIVDVNLPKFLSQDVSLFVGVYKDLFPNVRVCEPDRNELKKQINDELESKNLQNTPWFIEKILQIYEMILVRHGVMIIGEAMTGKTCAYQTLAQALCSLSAQNASTDCKEFPVTYKIVNPKAITMGQLYGCFNINTGEWSDGVIALLFRDFASSFTKDRKWIIFDGPVDAIWIENLNTVLDDNKKLCLISGEIIQMTNKMNILFEAGDLEHASPATVSRCGMIYFESSGMGWKPLLSSFNSYFIKKVLPEQYELIQEIIQWLIPAILKYLKDEPAYFILTAEQHLFQSFIKLFSALLEDENQVSTVWLQCTLLFSIIWGLCSTLTGEGRGMFDAFFRKLVDGLNAENPKPNSFKLMKNQLFPDKGTVFDFIYDKKNSGAWIHWLDFDKDSSPSTNSKHGDAIIRTSENISSTFFFERLILQKVPILLLGPTGTGKSVSVKKYLMSLPCNKFIANTINFSGKTTAKQTQEIIMSKLDKRRKGVFGPAMGKQCILFVENLNMPQKEIYGAQPPLELLRQWLDHSHWYDLKECTKQELVDVQFIGTMLPPDKGYNTISGRLIQRLYIIYIESFGDATLNKIFGAIIEHHLSKDFPEPIVRMCKNIISATLEVYKKVVTTFLPIPSKPHYTFDLRDFSKVVKGILLVPPSHLRTTEKLITLWVHEIHRVFYDRLTDENDRHAFFDIINPAVYNNYRVHLNTVVADYIPEGENLNHKHLQNIYFGNYIEPDADPKIYDQISDMDLMNEKMEYYLKEYNLVNTPPLQMVMFKYALEHISRVCRVLLQEGGHILLVGIDGSGRSSVLKLAASILEMDCFQIHMSRTYSQTEWYNDLRKLLMRVGIKGKPVAFLISDNQIKSEDVVEDLNMIINTGEIPNLYTLEDKAEIIEKMLVAAREKGLSETTPFALFNFFVERIKENLHIAFAMSPVGDSFRNKIRMFPSLVTRCTIDWFTAWPDEALEKVAYVYLKNMSINSEKTVEFCINACKLFHRTAQQASLRFYNEQKRNNYVTPSTYLELIKLFQILHNKKVDQIISGRNRYTSGLEQLEFAAGQVIAMQSQLTELQPQLVDTSVATEKLMIKIEQDTIVVEAQKEIVGADEALANEAAAAAQAIKDDCESDLAEAVPALESAVNELNTLKTSDITLIKSLKNPPGGVKLVMEAICVMKGVKCDRKVNAQGQVAEDFWGPSLKLVGDMKFLESLKSYDKDNINPQIMKRIRERYIPDRDFNPDVIEKASNACKGLCKWVRAMEVYDRVIKVVAPKKAALAEAEAELQAQMYTLNQKRAELQAVLDKLQALNDEFAEYTRKKKGLEDDISACTQKLERAEKLIGSLGGEKSRWLELAGKLQNSLTNVIGDVLLSAGFIAYLGVFTMSYRSELVNLWNEECIKYGITCSENFSLITTLGEPIVIRNWNISGLPIDNYSTENAIIIKKSRMWPLMIDPQDQANKWIKNMEKNNNIKSITFMDKNYLNILEDAIQIGYPIILENILETLDSVLDPLLLFNFINQGDKKCIKLREEMIDYNSNFRLYITSQLRNPHYLPETAIKVTLINFMITPQGLQDQLLGIVVAKDKPELEKQKNELIIESANNKKMLKEIEDQILEVLSAEGNILVDESANKILTSSKHLSEEIQEKQKIAIITEKEIDDARFQYIPVSKHGSIIFFCISDLAHINPMYQYSLTWFINLYNNSIVNAPSKDILSERLNALIDHFTKCVYENICCSLFEKDKLVFSFILTIGLLRLHEKIDEELFVFLLTGGNSLEPLNDNPAPEWLNEKSWVDIVKASNLKRLSDFKSSFESNITKWKAYYDNPNPQIIEFPRPYEKASGLMQLVILRCIRPDKLYYMIQKFITTEMGQFYVEPPPFDLEKSYHDSNSCSPLLFILSAGSDPMAELVTFASKKNINMKSISLGQGQDMLASAMISEALEIGEWVVLQNCHLMPSWMPELDRIFSEIIVQPTTHPEFRCWLTSYPSDSFPASLLQNGIKMIVEAPTGLKNNLCQFYTTGVISEDDFYENAPQKDIWHKFIFSLCFFHALIQERKKFGSLGWNIPYEFNSSDLKISLMQLKMFLKDYEEIPYEALNYLIGECNYGGRITDERDRRLLSSLLSVFVCSEVAVQSEYSFSTSGDYKLPTNFGKASVISFIKSFPSVLLPEVFGLHENANITKDNFESTMLLSGILVTQSLTIKQISKSNENIEIDIITEILNKLPEQFNIHIISEKYPDHYENCMNTILRQELIRYNKLLAVIKETLGTLNSAINGLAVMSIELEECLKSITLGLIPKLWKSKSYPSLKPLGSFISDLVLRLTFFQNWIDNGEPSIFWFSGFFFTHSFLTGVLQNYSRKHKISIDQIQLEFCVTEFENENLNKTNFNAYCKLKMDEHNESYFFDGLFLEGARWNRQTKMLDESLPKILYDVLPIIWMKPIEKIKFSPLSCYFCPIYRTSERRGILATTGHSSNFIANITLKTDKTEKHWINRGVACLTQLNH